MGGVDERYPHTHIHLYTTTCLGLKLKFLILSGNIVSDQGTLETLESIFIMISLIKATAIHRNAVSDKFEINQAFN